MPDLNEFFEKLRQDRRDEAIRREADLRDFAKKTLDDKRASKAAIPVISAANRGKVETTFTSTPMSTFGFEAPRGRRTADGDTTEGDTNIATGGAFYNKYVDGSGHTYLQGGTVTGGSGTVTIADIKVIDSGTGPVASAGHHLYINATGTGLAPDDVLIPGWTLTAATDDTAASVPANTLPEVGSLTGKKCYVDLGVFTADNFYPSATGNIAIYFCIGGYTVLRT